MFTYILTVAAEALQENLWALWNLEKHFEGTVGHRKLLAPPESSSAGPDNRE